MLRDEIRKASNNIAQALVDSGVREALKDLRLAMRSANLRQEYAKLLTAYGRYSALASEFGENEKRISRSLELEELLNAEFWSSLVSRPRINAQLAQRLFSISNRIIFSINHLPSFLQILEPAYIDEVADPIEGSQFSGKALLRVRLPEKEYGYSIPGRITQMLDSINTLYSACAMLESKNEDELVVIGCDSGADKSFDFLGDANVIAAAKQVLLSMWDRIVLLREMQLGQRNKMIAQTLPINETLEEMESSGDYDREYIAVLRNRLNKGVTMFATCGATLPEFEQQKTHEPRELLQPEIKLLAAPEPTEDFLEPELHDEADTEARYAHTQSDTPEEGSDEGADRLEDSDREASEDNDRAESQFQPEQPAFDFPAAASVAQVEAGGSIDAQGEVQPIQSAGSQEARPVADSATGGDAEMSDIQSILNDLAANSSPDSGVVQNQPEEANSGAVKYPLEINVHSSPEPETGDSAQASTVKEEPEPESEKLVKKFDQTQIIDEGLQAETAIDTNVNVTPIRLQEEPPIQSEYDQVPAAPEEIDTENVETSSVEDDIAAINKILGDASSSTKDYWSKMRSKI